MAPWLDGWHVYPASASSRIFRLVITFPNGGISTWMHATWVIGWMDGMCIPPVPPAGIFRLVIAFPNGGISTWVHAAWLIGWMDRMCIPPVPTEESFGW